MFICHWVGTLIIAYTNTARTIYNNLSHTCITTYKLISQFFIMALTIMCFVLSEKEKKMTTHRTDECCANGKKSFRIIVMGAARVGKTALVSRLMLKPFRASYTTTVEDFYGFNLTLNGEEHEVEIIDTSGSYCFPAMRDLYISKADLIILVYSLSDIDSFKEVENLYDQIIKMRGHGNVQISVIGNKVDLQTESQQNWQKTVDCIVSLDWEATYLETSAKNNVNVAQIIRKIAQTEVKAEHKRTISLIRRASQILRNVTSKPVFRNRFNTC